MVNLVAKPWSYEMAYRVGQRNQGDIVGTMIMMICLPICKVTGMIILNKDIAKQISSILLVFITILILFIIGKKFMLHKKILVSLLFFSMINLYGEAVKTDKVFMRIKSPYNDISEWNIFNYNKKSNLLLNKERWGWIYFWLGCDRYYYYYFKDNKYVGNNADDFDSVLEIYDNWLDYSSFPPKYVLKKNRIISGFIYKFEGDRLIFKGEIDEIKSQKIEEIDLNNLKIKKVIDFEKNGYPIYCFTGNSIDNCLGIFSSIGDFKYEVNYNDKTTTFNGKIQIENIKKYFVDKIDSIYNFKYDNSGRLIEIEEKGEYYEKNNNYNFLYFIYRKDNILFLVNKVNILKPRISITCRIFNKSGYYIGEGIPSTEDIQFNTYEELKNEIENINITPKSNEILYHYEKASSQNISNLKLQPILFNAGDLIEYSYGITSWFRYKYLNETVE